MRQWTTVTKGHIWLVGTYLNGLGGYCWNFSQYPQGLRKFRTVQFFKYSFIADSGGFGFVFNAGVSAKGDHEILRL